MRSIFLAALVILCISAIVSAGGNKHKGGHHKHAHHKGKPSHTAAAAAGGAGAVAAAKASKQKKDVKKAAAAHSSKIPILRGVNRSGTEYSCIKGTGLFEGPVDDNAIQKMVDWKINAVRVPVNEDCWLKTNGVSEQFGGEKYQTAIIDYVKRLRKHNLYVIFDLHWTSGLYTGNNHGACTEVTAKCQKPMPGKGAVEFWTSAAKVFKDDSGVIFDLFNEPFPDQAVYDKGSVWKCWKDGGNACTGFNDYTPVGMKDLLKAVRDAGANNLAMIGGIEWSNDLSGWLEHVPDDPAKNIAASMHSYDDNGCKDETCWEKTIGKISEKYPVIVGEIGEHDCNHQYIDKLMRWLDSKKISYLAWTFNNWDCGSGPALVTDFEGHPTGFGQGFKDHLANIKN